MGAEHMGTLLEHNTPLSKETSDPFALSIPSNPQSRFQSPQIPQIWESKPLLPVLQVELDSHCPFSSRHPLSSLSYLCTMLSTPQVLLPISPTSPRLPKLLGTSGVEKAINPLSNINDAEKTLLKACVEGLKGNIAKGVDFAHNPPQKL